MNMKLNSKESLAIAHRTLNDYNGNWAALRAAGTRNSDGVLIVPRKPKTDTKKALQKTG